MSLVEDHSQFDPEPRNYGTPVDIKPALAEAGEFPLDVLPDALTAAIRAIVDVVQVPVSIAANSVLGACSLVAQGRVMVEMPTRERVPASLYFATVAASGERKTSADSQALKPIREYEKVLRREFHSEQQRFTIDKAAYDAALTSAKNGAKKSRAEREEAMKGVGEPPVPPATPVILVEDFTIEGMTKLLDEAYPFTGIFSDDAARVIGGYSMQEGRHAATGAILSQMWDGKPILP